MVSEREAEAIPLLEEELRVGKQSVATGKVRVRTVVDRVEVTRVPVGREVAVAPDVRTEGDVLIVPVLEEVLVVEKRLVLKEELHIRRQVTQENVEVPVTLRKQRVEVERLDENNQPFPNQEETQR